MLTGGGGRCPPNPEGVQSCPGVAGEANRPTATLGRPRRSSA